MTPRSASADPASSTILVTRSGSTGAAHHHGHHGHGGTGRPPTPLRGWLWIALAVAAAWPWLFVRFATDYHQVTPPLVALLAGISILGAAFILAWGAEVFQMDVSQALALAFLSLIAVLPEYAVDAVFAWRAAADPVACRLPETLANESLLEQLGCQAPYAVANMTGSNRLLIGIGWSAVVLLAWWRMRGPRRTEAPVAVGQDGTTVAQVSHGAVHLERSQALELTALAAATLYSFLLPLKHFVPGDSPLLMGIGPIDTVVLVALFALYAWGTARAPAEAPHLVGPAATVGALTTTTRRLTTAAMFLYAAAIIFVSAEPFAEGLVHTGTSFGIDEFLLVQWLAPLASESPEFLVALLFAWRGMATAGLRTLVASKVNQWTLLIGTLGAIYSLGLGTPHDLPLDERQTEELLLTSAQSLFALTLIANFDLTVREALFLMGTFLIQLFFPQTEVRIFFAILYVVGAVGLVLFDAERRRTIRAVPSMVREAVGLSPAAP